MYLELKIFPEAIMSGVTCYDCKKTQAEAEVVHRLKFR